jgi:hypothetical protein
VISLSARLDRKRFRSRINIDAGADRRHSGVAAAARIGPKRTRRRENSFTRSPSRSTRIPGMRRRALAIRRGERFVNRSRNGASVSFWREKVRRHAGQKATRLRIGSDVPFGNRRCMDSPHRLAAGARMPCRRSHSSLPVLRRKTNQSAMRTCSRKVAFNDMNISVFTLLARTRSPAEPPTPPTRRA